MKKLRSKPAAESIKEAGGKSNPGKYNSILGRAIAIGAEMCRLLSKQGRETWAEAWGQALEKLMKYAAERAGIMVMDPVIVVRNESGAR